MTFFNISIIFAGAPYGCWQKPEKKIEIEICKMLAFLLVLPFSLVGDILINIRMNAQS